ncbi:MAG: CaiB/BaiF CoA-transferase family protein [Pseudomonadota bacterium]|nr:CaiB/BaiF CoA-transferase family protein [Pseudomonadota bacterium]
MSNSSLNGKVVVSIEQAVAAPYCSVKLADAGARVIKVERKEGDFARYYDRFVKGQSTYFVWLNRGKESLVADIKDSKDRELLKKIILKADIFIQNLLPGTLKKYKLDSKTLRKKNKRLITCDISGYGQLGNYANKKAYDLLIQAETGLCSLTGDQKSPSRVGISVCDIACGLNAYALILEAIIKRESSGKGAAIEISLFDSLGEWMNVPYLQYLYTKEAPKRVGLSHPSIVPYGCFLTKDNINILFSIQNEREWKLLENNILKLPKKLKNFFNTPSLRLKNKNKLNTIIKKKFSELSSKTITRSLKKFNIAYGYLNGVKEFSRHSQLKTSLVETEKGKIKFIPPVAIKKRLNYKKVPKLGQHSKKIKKEFY